MNEPVLLTQQHDYTRVLTLNRPDRMNALGRDLVDALQEALEDLRHNQKTRVIVLKGNGGKAFCAGADLKERAEMEPDEVARFVTNLRATFQLLQKHPKVTIAMLNGLALGGGLEMALACDMRYAQAGISLGLTETRLAIIPGAGGTQLLPRIIGPAKAKELIFKATPVTAETALSLGMVNHVFPAEELEEHVLADAAQISKNGPLALIQAKTAVDEGLNMSLDQGLRLEQACYAQVIPTEDRLEGLRAFKEKRTPQYKGH